MKEVRQREFLLWVITALAIIKLELKDIFPTGYCIMIESYAITR